MSNETIFIFIAAAAVVLLALFWRSKRDERRVRAAQEKLLKNLDDPLTVVARQEPEMSSMPEDEEDAADSDAAGERRAEVRAGALPGGAAAAAQQPVPGPSRPSDEPPVYDELEAEEERRAREEQANEEAPAVELQSQPPVDGQIEWVLDITPGEGEQFALGGIKSLENELKRGRFPLPVRLWARGIRDGLYCEARQLASPADHVVASIALANRAAKLDEVTASLFYQVLEHAAAGVDATVRREYEPAQAAAHAESLRRFIEYYDRSIDIIITPLDPERPRFELPAVERAAPEAGFGSATGRWEYRVQASDRDPVMTLAFGPEGSASLVLRLDLPLAVLSRGDLRRFLACANHIAISLGAQWSYANAAPSGAAGAVIVERQAIEHASTMRSHGAEPGGSRARILFSRSA